MSFIINTKTNEVRENINLGSYFRTEEWVSANDEQVINHHKDILSKKISDECGRRILAKYSMETQKNAERRVSRIHNKELISLNSGTPYILTEDEKAIISEASIGADYIDGELFSKKEIIESLNGKSLTYIKSFDFEANSLWQSTT